MDGIMTNYLDGVPRYGYQHQVILNLETTDSDTTNAGATSPKSIVRAGKGQTIVPMTS